MRVVVNKHCRVYLNFGRAGSLSLQLYCTYQNHRLLHVHVAVNSHALPVYKKNRIASIIHLWNCYTCTLDELCSCLYGLCRETCSSCWQSYYLKGNIAWHWLMSRRYLIAIENNKMFVAWWVNPFNIDMEGVATWTPSSYCFASLIFHFYA